MDSLAGVLLSQQGVSVAPALAGTEEPAGEGNGEGPGCRLVQGALPVHWGWSVVGMRQLHPFGAPHGRGGSLKRQGSIWLPLSHVPSSKGRHVCPKCGKQPYL